MAQRIQVLLVCDLHDDETPGTETITFTLDGASYEIDLCEQHAVKMRERFATYIGAGRRAGGRGDLAGGRGGRRRSRGGSGDAARIREWPRSQGLAVPERGRVPAELAEKYAAANPGYFCSQHNGGIRRCSMRVTDAGPAPDMSDGCDGTSPGTSQPPDGSPAGASMRGREQTAPRTASAEERACSNGSPTARGASSSWLRKKPGCSTTTTSAPSTSCSA